MKTPAVVPLPHRSLVRPPPKPSATLLFYLISITRLLTERDCCAQGLLHAFLETPPSVVAKAHAAPTRQAAGAATRALGPIASGTYPLQPIALAQTSQISSGHLLEARLLLAF